MPLAAFLAFLVAAMVGWGVTLTTGLVRNVDRTMDLQRASAIADGCLDYAYTYWRSICRDRPEQDFTTSAFATIPAPTSTLFPGATFTLVDESATGGDPAFAVRAIQPSASYSGGRCNYVILPGTTALSSSIGETTALKSVFYLANVNVRVPSTKGGLLLRARRVFEKARENPWQYAVFYEDDCEIHPGVAQSIDGWVHTNSDLYTAHNLLTLQDRTTFSGDWEIDFMPGDTSHLGETPTRPNYPTNLPPAQSEPSEPLGFDPTATFNTGDSNPNNDGYIELIERPVSGHSDPLQDDNRRFWYQADIRVIINSSGNLSIQRNDGTVVTSSSTGLNRSIYQAVAGSLTMNGSFRDNRIGGTVGVHTFDIGKFSVALDGGSSSLGIPNLSTMPWSGVLYFIDERSTSSAVKAFRLSNGGVLTSRRRATDNTLVGVTVVSKNPVYIKGDYNTGTTATTQPASNNTSNPNFASRTVSGYEVRPSAVVADATNILSNNWSDSRSTLGLTDRPATNTTVNTALVSGIVPTGVNGAIYSGGVENFPRFLEDWSPSSGQKNFVYYGSLIELYQSKQAIQPWRGTGTGPNIYDPPARRWYFDRTFLSNPPPGFLYTMRYIRQRWDATTAQVQ